jgi:hypothetical protein
MSMNMPTDCVTLSYALYNVVIQQVGEDANTHAHVPQTAVVCPPGQEIAVLASLLTSAKNADPTGYKVRNT